MQTVNQIKSTYPVGPKPILDLGSVQERPISLSTIKSSCLRRPKILSTHPLTQTSNSLRIALTSALSIRPTRIRAMYSWAALTPSNAQMRSVGQS